MTVSKVHCIDAYILCGADPHGQQLLDIDNFEVIYRSCDESSLIREMLCKKCIRRMKQRDTWKR